MNDAERVTLEVVRAEINGKLDLLLERTDLLRKSVEDHEARLRKVEEFGSPHAQVLQEDLQEVKKEQAKTNRRVAYAGGAVAALVTLASIFGPDIGRLLGG